MSERMESQYSERGPRTMGGPVPKPRTRPATPSRWQPVRPRLEERHVKNAITGCWEWIASLNGKSGYGTLNVRGRATLAHRASYEEFVGPIPEGHEIDHLCRNRKCINPEHLEPVTSSENHRRSPTDKASIHAKKTHCPKGHEYTPENTWMQPQWKYPHRFARVCRTCYPTRDHLQTLAEHLAEKEQAS